DNRLESEYGRRTFTFVKTLPVADYWRGLPVVVSPRPVVLRRITHTVSSHANWQPALRVTLSGQLAHRWTTDDHDALFTRTGVTSLGGRALYDLTRRFDVGATGR